MFIDLRSGQNHALLALIVVLHIRRRDRAESTDFVLRKSFLAIVLMAAIAAKSERTVQAYAEYTKKQRLHVFSISKHCA